MKSCRSAWVCFFVTASAQAQLSTSAYRALGQVDLRQNGLNRVQGVEMYAPSGIALDYRNGSLYLYVSDTRNNRVLAWPDVNSYQIGGPPAIVLGQQGPLYSSPLGIGVKGFNAPLGLAVDPTNGNLYVADFGDNRVLRFPSPFSNPSRVEPDAVYGQPNFNSRGANTGGIGANSLSSPRGVAFDWAGNLWIADSGNARVLRFNAAVLDNTNPQADLVIGQKDFISGAVNQGAGTVSASGFDTPAGLVFDQQNNLYVADFVNARVLKFASPLTMSASASAVFGQANFTARGVPAQPSQTTLAGPLGLAVDALGNLYVAAPNDNRILVFAANAPPGSGAKNVLGQADFTSTLPNPSSFPLASAGSFSTVTDVKVDPAGNLYVADSGNNRVISFPPNSKAAWKVWGQNDFSSNGVNQVKPGSINSPYKIAIDYSQSPFALYVSDTNNHRILVWYDATAFRSGDPANLAIGQPDLNTAQPNIDTRGSAKPSPTSLSSPRGIAIDWQGNLYVADSGNNRVLRYPRPVNQLGRITADTVIGQADFSSATSNAVNASSLRGPSSVAIGPDGDLFVADAGNNRVLEFPARPGNQPAALRVYGQPNFTSATAGSPASAQTLQLPQGVFVDAAYTLYVADAGNNRVLVFSDTKNAPASGSAASIVIGQNGFGAVAPGGGASGLRIPIDVALDSAGKVFVSDSGNNRVLIFPSPFFLQLAGSSAVLAIGQPEMTGNSPNWNALDSLSTPEGLYSPLGLCVDRRDTLYVGDAGNNRVVQFLKPAIVMHATGSQLGTPMAQGGLVSIMGSGLSDTQESASGGPLPFTLAGRQVVINDQLVAPLSTMGPVQASLQVPWAAPLGAQRIAVRVTDTGELIAGSNFAVAAASPELFSGGDKNGFRAILNQDNSANSSSNPAARGSIINVFGTGQGPVSPPVPDGNPGPDPPASTVAVPTADGNTCLNQQPSLCVAIGTVFGEIQSSGLAPGAVGIWQITLRIPQNAPTGSAVNMRGVIRGTPSNIVTVAIK